jgi:hypothetical protein
MNWNPLGLKAITCAYTHRKPSQYLAELLLVNRTGESAPYLWRDSRHKETYKHLLLQAEMRLKGGVDFAVLHEIIVNNKLQCLDAYADNLVIEYFKKQAQ